MKKEYTLKVFPAGAGREVYRVIKISGEPSTRIKLDKIGLKKNKNFLFTTILGMIGYL